MKNDKRKDINNKSLRDSKEHITCNMDSSYNYATNGTQQEMINNKCGYTPDTMRADADKKKAGYDIECRTPNKFEDDPMLQNNIVNAEFDYTKEETGSYLNPHK